MTTPDSLSTDPAAGDFDWRRTSVPFPRLVSVEARKLFDTRSGSILAALLVVVVVASIIGRGVVSGPNLDTLIRTAGVGLGTLLPVLSILTMTGEWSHRTALTTFTLEPRRARVLVAKCLPPLGTAVALAMLAMLIAVPVTAVIAEVQGVRASWEVAPLALLGWTGTILLLVAQGLALGMLLLNAPSAIVVYLSMPILWTVVGKLGSTGRVAAEWLDLNAVAAPLSNGAMTGDAIARLAVSAIFSIVIPLTLGMVRTIRKEVT